MNTLNCIWYPKTIEDSKYGFITTPPLGKPDPKLKPIEGFMRQRVYQKAQVGPTCIYYAARRISPHFGKNDDSINRLNEISFSFFRKFLSASVKLDNFFISDELKDLWLITSIASIGIHLHYPVEAFFMNMLMRSSSTTYAHSSEDGIGVSGDLFLNKKYLDQIRNKLGAIASHVLKIMLYRMQVSPVEWRPIEGPSVLLKVLKSHLYFLCLGDFGSHIFRYQKVVDYNPHLGLIYSGPLYPMNKVGSKFFCMHAILVIGIRLKGFMKGKVFFIDPQDPSGPRQLQKVYVMSIKDFLYRIKDFEGRSDINSQSKQFIWVGNPRLFLS